MKIHWPNRLRDLLVLFLALTLSNLRPISLFNNPYPDFSIWLGAGQLEVLFWFLAVGLAILALRQADLLSSYWHTWKENWIVLVFIVLAFASTAWSVAATTSLYRALVLLCSTALGAYIGTRYSIREVLEVLFWFGALTVILCYAVTVVAPDVGLMLQAPYNGAWRGAFWHRNHLGSILAFFNAVYFLRLISGVQKRDSIAILDGIFFLLSLALVVLSRSATGAILVLLLDGLIVLGAIWLRVRSRFRRMHYSILLGTMLVTAVLAFTNLDFLFGLFGRSASLTGRVPMWSYLLQEIIAERPWLGYGFGALWTLEAFRLQVQQAVGWGYQVVIADNGFLDILLHLGGIGLLVFLATFASMWLRSIRFAIRQLSLPAFLPLLVMTYALVANISFSLFLELDAFVWLVMVAIWFAVTDGIQPPAVTTGH
ncbi:MAG: O-antigen ligase family protein [Anaerolineales bacterium]|nr:O-antigen ligase family protein [Anaerolineales bacterium]